MIEAKTNELREVLKTFKKHFIWAGVFSLFINLLLLTSPVYMLQIYDRVLASRSVTTLVVISVGAMMLFMVYSALETQRSRVLVRIGGALDRTLSARVFNAVFKGALQRPGMTGQAVRDLDTVREFLTGSGLFAFFDAPWLPIYLLAVFLIHPLLGVVSTIGGVLLFILAVFQELATRKTLSDASAAGITASRTLDNSLRNAEAIAAMGMTPAMLTRWQQRRQSTLVLQALASDRAGLIIAVSKFVRIGLQTAILGFGAYLVIHNEITGGLMIASSIMMGKALAPIEMAVATWKQLLAARSAYARLGAVLAAVRADDRRMELPAPTGILELDRVIAAPPMSNIPVIKGISLRVAAGDVLGIIGPSAAGKSSLARLIVGVWNAHSGVVRIDGSDIQTWNKDQLGPHIGYLPQDIELFEGTVADNIARFSTVDPEAVIEAARLAGVHDMILQLPQGYDTMIGAGGATLSGGQRQRVGLARALYKTPALIVLDEPNSNLDRDGEAALARTLAQLKEKKRTTLVITHRPNILASVDHIMVMNGGLIESLGPRDEILGKYLRPQAVPNAPGTPAVAGQNTSISMV
jgi:PrtD family type I secretion system ABC transporter